MVSLIEDTRQKAEKHERKHRYWEQNGTSVVRSALPFGDYMPVPKVAVDTKANIQEICNNICGSGKEKHRFAEECKKAREHGSTLIFLIEDAKYKSVSDLFGGSIYLRSGVTIPGDQLAKAMNTMSERYGVRFEFCAPEEAGRRVIELLEHDDGK